MTDAQAPEPEAALAQVAALVAAGRLDEASAVVEALLARKPGRAPALVLRGRIAALRGDAAAAAAALDAALAASPGLPLQTSIGRLRLALGQLEAARAAFAGAVAANGQDAEALQWLAEALRRMSRFGEAEAELRTALAAAPANAAAWSNLGVVLQAQDRRPDALRAFRRAVELDPDAFATHLNLAGLLAEGDAQAEAEAAYRRVLELSPGLEPAQRGLAQALAARGETDEARAVLAGLSRLRLDDHLQAGMLQPPIPASLGQIEAARERCAATIAEVARSAGALEEPTNVPMTFYLSYQGRDDRPILTALDALLTQKAPELSYVAPGLARRGAGHLPGGRIRVGFVSQFLFNHTVGRVFRGLIRHLDASRFEVVVAHLPGAESDRVRGEIDAAAAVVLVLPAGLDGQRRQLEDAGLDVLFFTDIGMEPPSYVLARSRLAPVQAVGWGHPDTTGLASVDYQVSWDLAEPPGAEAGYAEALVRLPRLACWYEPRPPAPRLGRQTQGLPATGRLYGCLQSLFKLHPDFDAVLQEITGRDPQGWLVFAEGRDPHWETLLRRRWAAWPGLNERAVFLPRRPSDAYMSLLAEMDVLLDPAHFGSGNTFYDAMSLGLQVVTWPGAFARGRIVAAAYAQMGAGQAFVAPSLDAYAGIAVRAAHDPQAEAVRAELKAAAVAGLFHDAEAVSGFEAFLTAAVEAAGAGRALPSGWKPG